MSTAHHIHEGECGVYGDVVNGGLLPCTCGQHGPVLPGLPDARFPDNDPDDCDESNTYSPRMLDDGTVRPFTAEEAEAIHALVGDDEWRRQGERYAAWQAANPGKTLQQAFAEMCARGEG